MHAILSTWETSEAHHNGIQYIDYYIYFLSFLSNRSNQRRLKCVAQRSGKRRRRRGSSSRDWEDALLLEAYDGLVQGLRRRRELHAQIPQPLVRYPVRLLPWVHLVRAPATPKAVTKQEQQVRHLY